MSIRDIATCFGPTELAVLLNSVWQDNKQAALDMSELDDDGKALVRRMYEELIDEELSS